MGRSGSTHLCSILDRHPQIKCRMENFSLIRFEEPDESTRNFRVVEYGEKKFYRRLIAFPLEHIDDPSSGRIVQHLHDIYSNDAKACGFKLKFPMQFHLYPEVTEELARLKRSLRVICLSRRNVIKQAISLQNMTRLQSAINGKCNMPRHMAAESNMEYPFNVDVDAMLNDARQLNALRTDMLDGVEEFRARVNAQMIHVEYEDLLIDELGVANRVFEFLKVDPIEVVSSRYEKATPDNLASAVRNFEELRDAMSGTEFEALLGS